MLTIKKHWHRQFACNADGLFGLEPTNIWSKRSWEAPWSSVYWKHPVFLVMRDVMSAPQYTQFYQTIGNVAWRKLLFHIANALFFFLLLVILVETLVLYVSLVGLVQSWNTSPVFLMHPEPLLEFARQQNLILSWPIIVVDTLTLFGMFGTICFPVLWVLWNRWNLNIVLSLLEILYNSVRYGIPGANVCTDEIVYLLNETHAASQVMEERERLAKSIATPSTLPNHAPSLPMGTVSSSLPRRL